MRIETIFFDQTGRWRSGWRLAFFLLLFTFFLILFQFIQITVLSSVPLGYSSVSILSLSVGSLMSLAAAILAGGLCGKYLERLPFRALGVWFTKNWLKDLTLGLVFGALAVSTAVLVGMIFGGLRFQLNTAAGQSAVLLTLGVSLVIFLVAAAFEEALFRGYMLQTFTRAGLAWLAIALTSVFFGMVHLNNPEAGVISTVNTVIAGVWFSLAYLKTRTLWLPFGLHFVWNWMLGAFYGIEVSGLTDITTAPLLKEIDRGPVWLTGGDYGLEGGIAATFALIIFTLLIWYLPIFRPTEEMLALTDK